MLRRPALERRTSALEVPCLDSSSSTATKRSVLEVESILAMVNLLPSLTVTELRDLVADLMSRTATTTAAPGRATKPSNMTLPIPLLAPVAT
jgi:hypothetical protein